MKALFVWDSDYPWDIRVEKICNSLLENGGEVHLVCRNSLKRPIEDFYKGINIHRIPFLSGILNNIFGFPLFVNPVWLARIKEIVNRHHVDLIIVRDLPMALAAVVIAKLKKIPVILDMAECYPEFIRLIWKFERFKILNIFVRNPVVVDLIESVALRFVDHNFVVVEESRDRLIKKGVSSDKITIVSNTPILKRFQEARVSFPGVMRQNKGKLLLLYVGLLNFSRGLDTVLQSLSRFVEISSNVFLVIAGTGSAENYLKNMALKLNLEQHVGFEGWVDNKIVPEYVASSDVCLIPLHRCGHFDNTIANKIFDYMAASKPVLVSDMKPMERIVQQTNCGFVHKDTDTEDFVSQLLKLQNSSLRRKLGLNGLKAVQEHYNWDRDSARMLSSLGKIIKKDG